jgi:hypothetical protein
MDQFNVTTKLWPSGDLLDLGTDSNNVTVPSTFQRHAANFVTSMDGKKNFQFLFWNTGRRLTSKRHVRWNFTVGGWGLWTATRWYGIPGGGGVGQQRVHVESFKLADNSLMPPTAIDPANSTIPAGAFPFNGNDHEIGTAGGAVAVDAKNSLSDLEFAGWLQLIFGGDDSGEFVETDADAQPNQPDFFPHGSGLFNVGKGASADLLATYGNSTKKSIGPLLDFYREMLKDFGLPPTRVDPAPEDIRRLRDTIVQRLVNQTRPGQTVATDFQRFIDTAKTMSRDEATRARQSVQTSLDLGRAALNVLDARIKQG